MLELAENSPRGGMVNAITRHVVVGAHDDCKYIDANNLYGWVMLQKLPVGGFHWGEARKWENMFSEVAIMAMDPDSD